MAGPDFNYFSGIFFYTSPTTKHKIFIFCFGIGVVCTGRPSYIPDWTWLPIFFKAFLLYYPNAEAKNLNFLLRRSGSIYRQADTHPSLDLTPTISRPFLLYYPHAEAKNLDFLLRRLGSMYRQPVYYPWFDLTSIIIETFPYILPQCRSKKIFIFASALG